MKNLSKRNVFLRLAAGLATTSLLVACGGGGGGGSSTDGSGGGAAVASISGIASKGLIKNAKVSAFALNSDGTKGNLLATAKSNTEGRYTISGLPAGELVLLEVSPSEDGDTTMDDEATGLAVPLPSSHPFKLRAAAALEGAGTTTPAQITPFTDMAVKLAEDNGGIKPDIVAAANNTVSEFAGVSVLADEPEFDSSGKATNAAGVRLAAISELAKTGVTDGTNTCNALGGTPTEEEVLDNVKCVVDYLASNKTNDTVATQLNTALEVAKDQHAAVTDPVELAKIEHPISEQPTEMTVVEGAQQSAIQEAKKLIQSIRDTVAIADSTATDSLRYRLQQVADGAYGLPEPLDDGTTTTMNAVSQALGKITSATTGFDVLSRQVHVFLPSSSSSMIIKSRCEFYSSANFQQISDGATNYLGCLVLQEVVFGNSDTYPHYYQAQYAVYHRVRLTKQNANSYSLASALVKGNIGSSGVGELTALDGTTPTERTAQLTRVGESDNYTALTLVGDLAPGVYFDWSYNSNTYTWQVTPESLGSHQTVDVTLTSQAVDTNTRLNMVGTVAVFNGDVQQSSLAMKAGSYVQAATAIPGNIANVDASNLSAYRVHLIMEATVRSGFKFGGTLDLSNFADDDTRQGPKNGSFEGFMTDNAGVELFSGLLSVSMPTDSGLNWSATMNGTLVTAGTNTLSINLTGQQSATVEGDFSVTGTYTQGANTFTLTAMASSAQPNTNQVTFSTPTGVGFTYTDGDSIVEIKKGSTLLVGTFDVDDSRMEFADGTYQRF